MASTDDLDAAYDSLWESLPAHWQFGSPEFDPGRHLWAVSAVDLRTTGRGKTPRSVRGTGETPAEALLDLDAQFRGIPREADGTRVEELRRRLRLAYIEGAEEWTRAEVRRGLTAKEMETVVERFRSF